MIVIMGKKRQSEILSKNGYLHKNTNIPTKDMPLMYDYPCLKQQ